MKKILYLLLAAMALAGCTKTYTVPTVVTDPSPEVDAQHNNAVLHGTVTDDGGLEILEGGFYWGTDWDCDNRLVVAYPGNNLSYTLTGLTNGKTYYYRAYAKNKLGEASSETQHFVFHGLTVPSVTTGTYSVSGTTATCYGSATTQSGAPLTQAGICYRAGSGTPTTSNNVRYASGVNGNTNLSFSCQITGLSAGTYSYRAFATNSAGTSYGATKTFTVSGGGSTTLGSQKSDFIGTWTCSVYDNDNNTTRTFTNVEIWEASDGSLVIESFGGNTAYSAWGTHDATNRCIRLRQYCYFSGDGWASTFTIDGQNVDLRGVFIAINYTGGTANIVEAQNNSSAMLRFNTSGNLELAPNSTADANGRYANGMCWWLYPDGETPDIENGTNLNRRSLYYTNVTLTKTSSSTSPSKGTRPRRANTGASYGSTLTIPTQLKTIEQ